jgi:signal transduction histidine kinase
VSFGTQLRTGQAIALSTTLLAGVTGIVVLHLTTRSANETTRRYASISQTVDELRVQAEQLIAAGRRYLFAGKAIDRTRMHDAEARVDKALAVFERGDPTGATKLSADAKAYEAALASNVAARALPAGLETALRPARDALEADLAAIDMREQAALWRAFDDASHLTRAAEIAIGASTSVALLIALVLGTLVRRRIHEEYSRAKAAAAARDELLSIVSHDLRVPLNAIVLGADLVAIQGGAGRALTTIANAAQRMGKLVDELLDVARVEGGVIALAREPFAPQAALDTVAQLVRGEAEARSLSLAVTARAGELVGDRERVVQILCNLVGNALRYARSTVTLRAEPREGRVRFAVDDDGPGIPAEHVPRLFERNYQGQRRGAGLGLGLYICRRLVEAHGGTIGVTTRLGEGSTFWFDI